MRKTRRYDSSQALLDRLAVMPGADRAKVENLLALRARLSPFELAEGEIASTLPRALRTTVVNPKSLRNPLPGASLG